MHRNLVNKVVVVTGANGFVGSAVVMKLLIEKFIVRTVARSLNPFFSDRVSQFVINSISDKNDLSSVFCGAYAVIHTAARVHVMNRKQANELKEFRLVNLFGTINIANQAAKAGVKRFIYISSIKVNGEVTSIAKPFCYSDTPNPSDAYGISKYDAEEALRSISNKTGMEVVIIRPVLIYGPGVKGNFLSMMRFLYGSIPLPFACLKNKRSLVALGNLVDLIVKCIEHPLAANETFLVSDGEDLSVSDLIKMVSNHMGIQPILFKIPSSFIERIAALIGRRDISQRICGYLQVDITRTCRLLDWSPPIKVNDALKETVKNFIQVQEKK